MDVISYVLGKKAGSSKQYKFQGKTININANGTRTITPDSGYDGLTSVKITVNTPSDTYAPRYINFNSYTGTDLSTEVEELDIKNLEILDFMFNNCQHIVELDLSMWDTKNITSMQTMFSNCRDLKILDLSSFTLNNITKPSGIYHMFNNCTSLEKLDIRNMVLSDISSEIMTFINNVPTTCEIIVKNDTEKDWWNTTYPTYTNVKTIEE